MVTPERSCHSRSGKYDVPYGLTWDVLSAFTATPMVLWVSCLNHDRPVEVSAPMSPDQRSESNTAVEAQGDTPPGDCSTTAFTTDTLQLAGAINTQ